LPDEEPLPNVTPVTFVVSVDNLEKGDLGLSFHQAGKYLLVSKISAGPIKDWNKEKEDAALEKVKVMDRVVKINGEALPRFDMFSKIFQFGLIELTIERPRLLGVKVAKYRKALGVELLTWPGSPGVTITGIKDGLVTDFNKAASDEMKIKVDDVVIALDDDVTMDGETIMAKMKELNSYNMTVRSYSA